MDSLPAGPASRAPGLHLSWPLLVFVAALLWVMALPQHHPSLGDADTYWHLAAGRWIVAHQAVPSVDPFSHSMPGAPWTAHEWLSEVVIAQVHALAGWPGLVALVALSFAATLAYLTRFLLRRMEPIHALLFVALAAYLLLPNLLARPHLLVWPLIVLWFGTLVEAVEAQTAPPWWLAGVMALWANLHGSFTLGLVLALALAAEAAWGAGAGARAAVIKRWSLFWLLSMVASLATPHGVQGWAFTAQVLTQSYALKVITEWQPVNFQRIHPLEIWLLLVLGLALGGHFRLTPPRIALLLGLLHMALKHSRYSSMLGLVGTLLLATPLARHWAASTGGRPNVARLDRAFAALAQPARPLMTAGVLVVAAAAAIALGQWRAHQPRLTVTPAAALAAARLAGAPAIGPVFNAYGFGGYLIEQGIPVFMDGRSDMYGDNLVRTYVNATRLESRAALTSVLDKYRIAWTLLEPGTAAIAVLDTLPGWQRLHTDPQAVVHVRSDP